MKLSKKSLLVVSVMLFALFFGAGNLIFSAVSGTERRGEYPSGHDRVPCDGGGAAGAWRGGGRAVRWAGKAGKTGGGAVRAGVYRADLPVHRTGTGNSQSRFRSL